MELGARIRAARLETGLSQRQLCGEIITRNMLSQIENGTARPSMDTLAALAAALGKPVSFFLEEQAVTSPNLECMARARQALAMGDGQGVMTALAEFRAPDDVFYEELQLLKYLGQLELARQALEQGRQIYALRLLERLENVSGLYITSELRRQRQLLLGQAGGEAVLFEDDALLVLAGQAQTPERALELLGAAAEKTAPRWNYLQAEAEYALGRYADALAHYALAGESREIFARMEICCRELGDFKGAYEYACKQR